MPAWSCEVSREVDAVAAQRRRDQVDTGRPEAADVGVRVLLVADAHHEHDIPLQALGPVDGQQLDRVGLGRGADLETVAVVALDLEPGEQGREARRAVDGLELGDGLDEQVEVLATCACRVADRRGELDVDSAGVDDPAHQLEQRLAHHAAEATQLGRQQPEPGSRLGRSTGGRPGPRERRPARRHRWGLRPRRPGPAPRRARRAGCGWSAPRPAAPHVARAAPGHAGRSTSGNRAAG